VLGAVKAAHSGVGLGPDDQVEGRPPVPRLVGDVGVVRDNAKQLKFTPGATASRIDGRGTAVCLSQLNARPVAAQSCTRVDDRDGCRTGD
jgi:hypothetical protein